MRNIKIFGISFLIGFLSYAQSEPVGILLDGPPTALAISILKDYTAPRRSNELEVTKIKGNGYHLQLVHAIISPKATVLEVNRALESVGARLSFSLERSNAVTLTLPPVKDLDEVKSLTKNLLATKAFVSAGPSIKMGPWPTSFSGRNQPLDMPTGNDDLKSTAESSKPRSK